jgi:monomeric isocitrate dehydrogenase
VTLYWADFLSQEDPVYKLMFKAPTDAREEVIEEIKICQEEPVDLGGYYLFDPPKARDAMNLSPTLILH